jgi:hypothetical protein
MCETAIHSIPLLFMKIGGSSPRTQHAHFIVDLRILDNAKSLLRCTALSHVSACATNKAKAVGEITTYLLEPFRQPQLHSGEVCRQDG